METIKWGFDPLHSELEFKIRHLMISHVSGSFKSFKIDLETRGDDFETAKVRAVIDIASIDTRNEQRDNHLRNSDFFEADTYPQMIFESTEVVKVSEHEYTLHGNLQLKGVTRPVILEVVYSGIIRDPFGSRRGGFTVSGKIRRSDFGLSYNAVLETGGVALGEEVKISAELQFIREAAAVPA